LTIQRTSSRPANASAFQRAAPAPSGITTKKRNCRFWVFEEAGFPARFSRFFEATDARRSCSALKRDAPKSVLDPQRVYTEVELS
jgi:hypothetical protein